MRFCFLSAIFLVVFSTAAAQTPALEAEIFAAQQAERLKSADVETRRDAVHRLLLQENAVAARAATAVLNDKVEVIRATAAKAVSFLADEDAAAFLTPLLAADKSEFVRREAAFALGEARSKTAVPNLIQALKIDKTPSVRAASAIALGKIADERAIDALSQTLLAPNNKKNRKVIDEFVRRSAARALGEIRHKRGVQSLITALRDTANAPDVRREAAFALGEIANDSAVGVLEASLNSEDYLLADIAANALQKFGTAWK